MVKHEGIELDRLLYAISDSTRRSILDELFRGGKTVSELAKPFEMSLPGFLKHIKILRSSGLISTQKIGRSVTCNLEGDNLMRVATWLAKYNKLWESRFKEMEENIRQNAGSGYKG